MTGRCVDLAAARINDNQVIKSGSTPIRQLVDQVDLVPGDILTLYPTAVVGADARLVNATGLFANEALLDLAARLMSGVE